MFSDFLSCFPSQLPAQQGTHWVQRRSFPETESQKQHSPNFHDLLPGEVSSLVLDNPTEGEEVSGQLMQRED